MKIKQLFCWLLVFMPFVTQAAPQVAATWKKANECYSRKSYDSAAALYEQLAVQSPNESLIYYNLGNAYYRLNKIGPAILNYERALKQDPGNELAKDNLMLARKRMSTPLRYAEDIFFIRWWDGFTNPVYATILATCTFLLFVLMIVGFLVRILAGEKFRLPMQVPYFLGFLWAVSLVPSAVAASRSLESGAAVVMMNDTPLTPTSQKGKPLGLLPEGTTVKIRNVKGDMAEVVIPDGRTGWVQLNWITRI